MPVSSRSSGLLLSPLPTRGAQLLRVALLATVVAASSTSWGQAPPDEGAPDEPGSMAPAAGEPTAPPADDAEPEAGAPGAEPAAPTTPPPPALQVRPPPALPTNDDLRQLAEADQFSKGLFRRVARTSPSAAQRAYALRVLAVRSPRSATAHICSRSMRLDVDAQVRRAAAECLGRLPARYASSKTPALLAALNDEDIDVVTMAAWALANVGRPEALGPLVKGTHHEDVKVARLFYTYAERLRLRHGLDYVAGQTSKKSKTRPGGRLVPPSTELFQQVSGMERSVSAGWLALYGGMSGWLHGGLLVAAHGPKSKELSLLSAVGGVVIGAGLGGAYGFFAAPTLRESHTVVQLGTMAAIAGYGAGLLSDQLPSGGVNAASLSALGTLVGTGAGILLNESTAAPSAGALASGFAVSVGAATMTAAAGLGTGLPDTQVFGFTLVAAGVSGIVTTTALAQADIGLRAPVFGTLGGVVAAGAVGGLVLLVEGPQLQDEQAPLSTGSGLAVAGAYAAGAAATALLAVVLIPEDLDPFLAGITFDAPGVGVTPSPTNPNEQAPVAVISGRF